MLLLVGILRAHKMAREATLPLMRASYEETPLRAALLLEQSAQVRVLTATTEG